MDPDMINCMILHIHEEKKILSHAIQRRTSVSARYGKKKERKKKKTQPLSPYDLCALYILMSVSSFHLKLCLKKKILLMIFFTPCFPNSALTSTLQQMALLGFSYHLRQWCDSNPRQSCTTLGPLKDAPLTELQHRGKYFQSFLIWAIPGLLLGLFFTLQLHMILHRHCW